MLLTTVTAWFNNPFVQPVVAGLIAFGYGAYLAITVSRKVRPTIPITRWWLTSVASALIAAGMSVFVQHGLVGLLVAALVPILFLTAVVDAKTQRIPNAYTSHALLLTAALALGYTVSVDARIGLFTLVAGASSLILLMLMSIVTRGGLGMGDVKISGVLAGALAMIDVTMWPTAVFDTPVGISLVATDVLGWILVAFLAGGIFVIFRRQKGARFAFGPFLVVAWLLTVVATPWVSQYAAQFVF